MEILRAQLGKTIIMVTHDPKAAARAQRILAPGEGPTRPRHRVGSRRRGDAITLQTRLHFWQQKMATEFVVTRQFGTICSY